MKIIRQGMVNFAIQHFETTIVLALLLTALAGAFFPYVKIDTDPEHMLPADEPTRLFHNQAKKTFDLSEILVMGIVNEQDPDGVFNPQTLSRVYQLAEYAKTLRWEDENNPGKTVGVISVDMIAPSEVEHISQDGPGRISFDWLMSSPPADRAQALEVRQRITSNPMLAGRLASEDGQALCLYLPLTDKLLSYRVYKAMTAKMEELGGNDEIHITGLPVAQDAIGIEMFSEMMISSPLAMGTIFLLLFFFFRKLSLTILPMLIATFTVIITMGAMIGLDFEVHIMSSMIPVFLMSIAVVDSIHILSEFFDRYSAEKGRDKTIREVLDTLFMPMLYTSLTSAAGFLSLALTPIPPVQIFGVFVGAGIMVAWVMTIMFVPAFIMALPKRIFDNFGLSRKQQSARTPMTSILAATGSASFRYARPIVAGLLLLVAVSAWGISKIQINDNPVKWFAEDHPIRKADTALNKHFKGTYPAYLILEGDTDPAVSDAEKNDMLTRFKDMAGDMRDNPQARPLAEKLLRTLLVETTVHQEEPFLNAAIAIAEQGLKTAESDNEYFAYEEFSHFFNLEKEKRKPFKQPQVLEYVAGLQDRLLGLGLVGKSVSPADVVSKLNQELIDGRESNYRVPEKMQGVSECYMQFQQSHRPHDLWHFVTPDYVNACTMFQLSSGDNKVMEAVKESVDEYFAATPPPVDIKHSWAGLTYINVAWQSQMVQGMLRSFLGSFAIVLVMAVFLFRSVRWGLLCMVPLTVTIALIYGFIGLIGKDYDMPVAVLGVLTLGMSVDFAIHFVERSRSIHARTGSWKETLPLMFREPARAISRNVLVISIGFLPLLVSSLVPYKTTSLLLSSIMLLSGALTLVALPAIITMASGWFFARETAHATATIEQHD
ncbi:efflux RND transporter permease subunit [Salidesulfovibrio onnuriiensis]|uniref:efflux RND transporter permease subunit n=1 Tax=Salidesulfovibrio onnuriiensis TaxID=2583823 RepID=UPI0011C94164|nr:MMPL family transporter [Salidesulfovibrio onnuriiensis]